MTCMFCGKVEEPKAIEVGFTDPKKRADAEREAAAQAERLSQWKHIQATITDKGARVEVLAGDVCPDEVVVPGALKLVKAA